MREADIMDRTPPMLLMTILSICLVSPLALADGPLGPGAPPNLTATPGPGAGEVSLAWEAASSLLGVTSYNVYHLNADNTRTLIGSTNGTTLAYVESGLPNSF